MVKCCRLCPFVAARIWECDHEPYLPDNKVDQPYWQGQIGLDLTPPLEIWSMCEFCEAAPEQQEALANPPLSARVPRGNRAPAYQTAPLALWRRDRARRITQAEYEQEVLWLAWASKNAPTHCDFTWRKPLDRKTALIPKFSGVS